MRRPWSGGGRSWRRSGSARSRRCCGGLAWVLSQGLPSDRCCWPCVFLPASTHSLGLALGAHAAAQVWVLGLISQPGHSPCCHLPTLPGELLPWLAHLPYAEPFSTVTAVQYGARGIPAGAPAAASGRRQGWQGGRQSGSRQSCHTQVTKAGSSRRCPVSAWHTQQSQGSRCSSGSRRRRAGDHCGSGSSAE